MLLIPSKSHLFIETLWFYANENYQEEVRELLSKTTRTDVIIDNSTHILKEPMSYNLMANVIEFLPEDHNYILVAPDYLGDFSRTLAEAIPFISCASDDSFYTMGVCQGISGEEYRTCHDVYVALDCYAIGFPFRQEGESLEPAVNRKSMIDHLIMRNCIRSKIHYHLFGLNYLDEYKLYKDYNFIKSCDSSKIDEIGVYNE